MHQIVINHALRRIYGTFQICWEKWTNETIFVFLIFAASSFFFAYTCRSISLSLSLFHSIYFFSISIADHHWKLKKYIKYLKIAFWVDHKITDVEKPKSDLLFQIQVYSRNFLNCWWLKIDSHNIHFTLFNLDESEINGWFKNIKQQ